MSSPLRHEYYFLDRDTDMHSRKPEVRNPFVYNKFPMGASHRALIAALFCFCAPSAAQSPSGIRSHADRARLLIQAGKRAEALKEVRWILDNHPGDPEAQFEGGALLQDLAAVAFQRLETLAPGSAETHQLLGKYYEAHDELPRALEEYRQALAQNPSVPGIHFLIGNVLWKSRDLDAAGPELEAELRINPGHTRANQRLGNIYISSDQAARAIPYLEKAVAAEPAPTEPRRDLGKAYRLVGRLDDALRELRIAARDAPEDQTVHAQLAAVYGAKGDTVAAAEELKRLREILDRRFEVSQRKNQ
jgi:tetratricopeptide (TPR) repeat protein